MYEEMDKRLKIVERLYESGPGGLSEHPIGSEKEEELRGEYQAMSQVKFWLDHRRAQRPDAATVDRIVKAAAEATICDLPQGVRTDAEPLRLLRGAPLRMVAAAAVVIAAVGIGLWHSGEAPPVTQAELEANENRMMADKSDAPPAPASEDEDAARSGREERAALEGDPAVAARSRASGMERAWPGGDDLGEPATLLAAIEPSRLPEWGHPEELVQIRQRIEHLKARQSELGWDKPLVPLEIVSISTGATGNPGIRQAGAKE